MMAHCVLQSCESAVVKKGRLQSDVAQRGSPKLVTILGIAGDLFEPKVFIRRRTVEDHVADGWRDLWNADDVLLEIAEHFVRVAGDGVAFHTAGLAKEEQGAFLLV